MKLRVLPLALAAALGMTGTQAFAVEGSGEVRFEGTITDVGCPIEVVNPGTGAPNAPINLGDKIHKGLFKTAGDTAGYGAFSLRITPGQGCDVQPGDTIKITFKGANGGAARDTFALEPGGATNLGLAMFHGPNLTRVVHDTALTAIPLNETAPTDIPFTVNYESLAAAVTVGRANARVGFVIEPN